MHVEHPWAALWAMVLGFFMILVDSTIVSVATPDIMSKLGASVNQALWVTSAYLLTYAIPLLISGRLGDRFGPKNLFLAGLVVFTASSAACGLAGSITTLIVFRAVQGLGAALMTPQTMSVITRTFPPQRRGAAMSIWGSVAGVALIVGPLAGGLLVDAAGWPWIFFVNVPVGIIAFVAAWRFVPALETHSHRFDIVGVVLNAGAMFLIVFGVQEGESYHWGRIAGPITVWRMIAAGVVLLALFVWSQSKVTEPLIPLTLFRDRNFSLANVGIQTMGFIMTGMAVPMMMYAQVARGLTPTQSALLLIPTAVTSGALAPVIGKQIDRRNPKGYAIVGFALLAASLTLYWRFMDTGHSILMLLIPAALMGIAQSGIWGPLSVSATRNLPPQLAGAGSGIYNMTRQVGAVIGSAAIAALMQARLTANLPAGVGGNTRQLSMGGSLPAPVRNPFSHAMGQTLLLPAAVCVVGLLAVAFLELPRHLAAQREGTATDR